MGILDKIAESEEPKEYNGKITHLDPKGFGFIASREVSFTRIFFHWTALPPTHNFNDLTKGQEVKFQTRKHPERGTQAIKIKIV